MVSAGVGQCESRKNLLGERNTNLRSAPPSHAATADGCVVKHKIECIGNSDVTFHIKAGAQVRQVEDRTIDRRRAALKGDACFLESAAARRVSFRSSCFGLSIVRSSGHTRPGALPVAVIAVACVVRFKTRSLGGQPCAKRAARAACKSYERAPREIGRAEGGGKIEIKIN